MNILLMNIFQPLGFLLFSGCIGFFCPCFLFAKNAEFLGSGTLAGSCMTHLIFWALVNTVCCLLSDGTLLGLPGCFVACYACGYRRALRSKYNLQVCSWHLVDLSLFFFFFFFMIKRKYIKKGYQNSSPKYTKSIQLPANTTTINQSYKEKEENQPTLTKGPTILES